MDIIDDSSINSRRWVDLDKNCLVEIFSRLDTVDLVLFVPRVCKSWYQVSLDPRCWTRIDFRHRLDDGRYSFPAIFKVAASRSQGRVTTLVLPRRYNLDHWLVRQVPGDMYWIPKIIGEWRDLKHLSLAGVLQLQLHQESILTSVCHGCPKLENLEIFDGFFFDEFAAMMAEQLGPRLKYLGLFSVYIESNDLLLILKACRNLRCLRISHCSGFPRDDPDIMKCGAAVPDFAYQPLPPSPVRDSDFDVGRY